jgi:hypothetical protein
MKKNLPLIIGISLPVIFVAILAVIVYLPSTFINPQHNFLYTENNYGSYANIFSVKDNKVVLVPTDTAMNDPYYKLEPQPKLYIYDFEKSASYEVTLAEAQRYFVEKGPSSPDGYSIERNYGHSGIFEIFGSYEDNSGQFIVSPDGNKRKLNGLKGESYYDINIVGWIK